MAENQNGGEVPVEDRRLRRREHVNTAFKAIKAQHAARRTPMELFAYGLTAVASSSAFFALHAIWFAVWILWNTGSFGLKPFDPYPFGLLTMIVSLEAIFLTIFVLMSQRRESAIGELREELTLQVNLRMEEEVTKTLHLVAGLYTRMGQQLSEDSELQEMLRPLDAEKMERDLKTQLEDTLLKPKRKR
jgi:uncharacterized membrane protein